MAILQTAVVLLAIANGLFAALAMGPPPPQSLPLSPVLALVILAIAREVWRAPPIDSPFAASLLALAAAGSLVPSSLAAWLALLAASALGLLYDRPRKSAHQLICGLAILQLWKAFGFKMFAAPLLQAEAVLLTAALQLAGYAPEVDGNIVRISSQHTLVLLAGCSSFSELGTILLGWSAMFRFMNPSSRLPARRLAMVAAAAISINVLRLVVMAWDPGWYEWAHNGSGSQIYDALVCAIVVSIIVFPATGARQSVPVVGGTGRPLCWTPALVSLAGIAVLALAAASLTLKANRYAHTGLTGWQHAETSLKRDLLAGGFVFVTAIPLSVGGLLEALVFEKQGCAPLFISLVGENADTTNMLSRHLNGAPAALLLNGRPAGTWPALRVLAANLADRPLAIWQARPSKSHLLLSVSPPPASVARPECAWPKVSL